ncbi:MAG: RICIN domain-containing protein [Clostridia bacterium]|nr:RICIN domain-containing protein [Clostridia bacterium]
MKKMKSVLSILLIIAMMTVFAPMTKAATLTESQFANKISQLKSVYKQGEYWNEYNSCKSNGTGQIRCSGSADGKTCVARGYCGGSSGAGCTCKCGTYYENGVAMAWQCMGFAHKMGYEVFGDYLSSSAWEKSSSLGTIYAGDIIRIKNRHSIFVIKVVGETVYYADCNRTGPCQVDWTGSYTKSQIASFFNYKHHHKGNTLTGNGSSSAVDVNYTSITKGNYTLKNAYNGKLLEVAGGVDADKTNIQVAAAANSAKQRFYISPASTGYKMRPLSSSSRLVNAWGSAPANGANVNIYKDCNENSQWWYFEKVSGGYVIRLAYNSSLVLTLSSSDNVTVTTYSSGNKKQIWTLEAVANPKPPKPTTTEENLSMNYKSTKELSGFKSITTSNSDVVSVSGSTISAVGTGSADITATRANGDTCIYHVNVSYTWWQWMIVICLFGWAWY